MKLRHIINSSLRTYFKSTSGGMAITFSLSLVAATFAVGASYDLAQLTKAKQIAQMTADNMALAASIAVDQNNSERYVGKRKYPYSKLGGAQPDFTNSMQGFVVYDIVDDLDPTNVGVDPQDSKRLLARATVEGQYTPSFLHAFGYTGIDFVATSDVAYAARQGTPASIFFVTDNSGSMGGRDENHVRKIDSLRTSMIGFMGILGQIPSQNNRIFRTSLFPYNKQLIQGRVVDPDWGTLSNNEINRMNSGGGTRSTVALTLAKSKFNLENDIHDDEHGNDEPLKFLIFMSDGANNGSYNKRVCHTEQDWIDTSTQEYWWKRKRGKIKTTYKRPRGRNARSWTHVAAVTSGYYGDVEVCENEAYSPENVSSLAQCTAMKASGVKIYSIAYDVSRDERALAEQFMKDCSSNTEGSTYTDEGYYKYATNGADLQAVFDEIGNSVLIEVVRIKR